MKFQLKVTQEVEAKTFALKAEVRCWEDAEVNGVEDTDGDLIPFREDDLWCPIIDIDTGIIKDWPQGTSAQIYYKVCDCCGFEILSEKSEVIFTQEDGYVPKILCPKDRGYGDYIIMDIDENGKIDKWDKTELQSILTGDEE